MTPYEALKHAVRAHGATLDKCDQPYILHPIAVAEAVERGAVSGPVTLGEHEVVVALLHDVWEDTDYPWLYLELEPGQRAALSAITRAKNEPYAVYLDRVCAAPIAAYVKLADLWHNLSPERQICLPPKERESLEKRYLQAREWIWEALDDRWWPTGHVSERDDAR